MVAKAIQNIELQSLYRNIDMRNTCSSIGSSRSSRVWGCTPTFTASRRLVSRYHHAWRLKTTIELTRAQVNEVTTTHKQCQAVECISLLFSVSVTLTRTPKYLLFIFFLYIIFFLSTFFSTIDFSDQSHFNGHIFYRRPRHWLLVRCVYNIVLRVCRYVCLQLCEGYEKMKWNQFNF